MDTRTLKYLCSALVLALAAPGRCPAQESASQVRFRAGMNWELTQIVRSTNSRIGNPNDSAWLNGFWMQSVSTDLYLDASVGKNLHAQIGWRGSIDFGLPSEMEFEAVQSRGGSGYMRDAWIAYSFGDSAAPGATVKAGYFPYGYAPENRILGEYMFKSGTYPGYVLNDDEDARIVGLLFTSRLPSILEHNLILTVEMDQRPAGDISSTYIGKLGAGMVLEFNAGIMAHRWLRTGQGQAAQLNGSRYANAPVIEYGDTLDRTYQKAGTKLMGRMVFSPNKLIGSKILGPEDLKLYAEAALLGVKNYGGFYDKISERIPVMAGFNVPVFKVLDVLSVEAEYYGSPWRNNSTSEGAPIPYKGFDWQKGASGAVTENVIITDPTRQSAGDKGKTDNIKWSVYALKTIRNRLGISARIASDHFNPGGIERLHAPDEFYWHVEVYTMF